jgi:hypothetical protein
MTWTEDEGRRIETLVANAEANARALLRIEQSVIGYPGIGGGLISDMRDVEQRLAVLERSSFTASDIEGIEERLGEIEKKMYVASAAYGAGSAIAIFVVAEIILRLVPI